MDVFNKVLSQVTSSVSTTVSQISGVLPGNPVTREFESSAHIASAGPGLSWKIYRGIKRSTKQEASIFLFEKRQLEKYNKNDRELILEILRKGVVQLTKIRHPKLLTVQHPLEESRDSLAFATEPVFASLSNILGQTTNMPQPANLSDYKLFDIEIKYGLLQITDGLAFLHHDMKLLHKNICPESIVINSQGAWKIFGLDFCVHNTSAPNQAPDYPFEECNPTLPSICQPNLDYLAPECITLLKHSPASDMFSLGMLAYTMYSLEKKCYRPVRDLHQFKGRIQELKKLNSGQLKCVPEELRDSVKLLLSVTPDVRPDAYNFLKIPFFDDVGIKTLTYLDSLLQWDNLQKSQFYKGLPEALTKLPHRVKVQRVLACLVHDLGQPAMVPFILPSMFDIAQECTKQEFCTNILPHLKPLMKLMEPVQDEYYWKRRYETHFHLVLRRTPPNWTWKSLYLERHIQKIIEEAQPQYADEENMNEILELCAPYIRRVTVGQLQAWQPPLTMDNDDIPEVYPTDHINFTYILKKLPDVTEFDLVFGMNNVSENFKWDMFKVTVKDCQTLGKALLDLKNLRILSIHKSKLEDKHCQVLMQSLVKNLSLFELNLSNCQISDNGALCIAKFLGGHPSLKKLNLSNNLIGKIGAEGLGFTLLLPSCATLDSLNLRLNPLGTEGAMGIMRALVRCSVPRELIMSGCNFEEDTPIKIGQMIKLNESLKKLDISNNWFGHEGGEYLIQAIEVNTTLEWLDVRGTDITYTQQQQIKKFLLRNRTGFLGHQSEELVNCVVNEDNEEKVLSETLYKKNDTYENKND